MTGFESTINDRRERTGAKCSIFGLEMVTLENGGVVKSLHGDLYKNNIGYVVYGSKGRMESAREDAQNGGHDRIYVNADPVSGAYGKGALETYLPAEREAEQAKGYGHGGSDFWSMYYFIEKIRGDETADTIDVYEALDMALPGLFAYRSILAGGKPMEIPDLRKKAARDKWRNDTACTDPAAAGDMLLPTRQGGTPEIPDAVYDEMKAKWEQRKAEKQKEN